ncbi:MAG: polyketide synthase [Planctomycetota bacterium]
MKRARDRLSEMRLRARSAIWIEAGGASLGLLVGHACATLLLDRSFRLEWPFRLAFLLALVALGARLLRNRLLRPLGIELTDDEMALAVERVDASLGQALISSVQFERFLAASAPSPAAAVAADSPDLMRAVVEHVESSVERLPFRRALDGARVARFAAAAGASALLFGAWGFLDPSSLSLWARRNLLLSSDEWPRYTKIEFKDFAGQDVLRVPQGDPLTVVVGVRGPVPEQVFLHYEFAEGDEGDEPMSETGDREFSWTLPAVMEDGEIRVEGGDGLSRPLRLSVVERPRIENVDLRIVYPDYMRKEPAEVAATEADLRIPRGGYLEIAARSHKPILEAFLMASDDRKRPLALRGDHSFAGEYRPERSGLVELNVIDVDRLGSASPPRLMVRLVDDRPPTLDFRLRGIGMLVTPRARIPGDLKVRDDFGITSISAEARWVEDRPSGEAGGGKESASGSSGEFVAAIAQYGTDLVRGDARYESTTLVDLLQWNPDGDSASPRNRITPGMLLGLRFWARDNFGPEAPHSNSTEVANFRVVTSEKLLEELRRRQMEIRSELQQVLSEERTATVEIKEMLNPASGHENAPRARARLRALSRQQTALGRRVSFIGESYQKVLWEYENNRMWESARVREVEGVITEPLAGLARRDFPVTSRAVESFAQTGDEAIRASLLDGYAHIAEEIERVLRNMEQAETLATLLESLRNLITVEDRAIRDVEKRLRDVSEQMFGPEKGRTPNKDDKKNQQR